MAQASSEAVTAADFPTAVDREFRKGEGYRVLYVNASRSGLSPFDIRLTLGQVVETDDKPPAQIQEDFVALVMSPQHAKAFARSVAVTVAAYEKIFGEITDVKKIVEDAAKAAKAKKA